MRPGTVRFSTAVTAASTNSSGTVRATANDGSNPGLLFRRAMNGHVVSLLAYAIFRVGEEFPPGKSNETLEGQVAVAIWQRN